VLELAPHHKIGLSLANPTLLAAGCVGYGQTYRQLIDLSVFGALVTNPITLRPQRGSPPPRLVETPTGLILNTGNQNPGVKQGIRYYSKLWRSLPLPVIAHLPAAEPDDLQRTARALAGTDTVAAIELGLPREAPSQAVRPWVRAIHEACMLPVLAKCPLGSPLALIEAALEAGVDSLVIGGPPPAAIPLPDSEQIFEGYMYGPVLYPLALYELRTLAPLVEVPLIASGGIHTLADAQTFLSAGAVAVQLDTLLWVNPAQAEAVGQALR
jgi:dihydroorotate dehydrogenase (NAD+) catalytic subunit